MMDNAPSNTCNFTWLFINLNEINHFPTPAQSSVKNLFKDLMLRIRMDQFIVFLMRQPQSQFDLIKGVRTFWKTKVDAGYCN